MRKRMLAMIFAALMACTVMTGCGGGTADSAAETASNSEVIGSADEKTAIVLTDETEAEEASEPAAEVQDETKEETVVEEGKQTIEEKGPFRKISLFGEAKRKEYIVALKDHTFYQKENTFTTKEAEAHVFSFYKEAKAISRVYHGKVLGR